MEKYNNRNEVPEEYKWNLSDFFKDEEDFYNNLKQANNLIEELTNYKNCVKDGKKTYEFLTKEINTSALCMNLYAYAYLINDQELGKSSSIKMKTKTINLFSNLEVNTSFFAPELLKLTKQEYENLFIKEPKLLEFKLSLDKIYRKKDYVLNENEEKIVSSLVNSMNNYDDISSNLINSEHNYGEIELEDGTKETIATTNYNYLLKNKNRNLRKEVYEKFNTKLNEYGGTCAGLLNSYVSMNNTLAKIYKYESSWDQHLFNLNLSDKVFKTLVNIVKNNYKSLHKYYDLRKKILNLPVLQAYDLSIEISNCNKEYSIKEAQDMIRNSLKPLKEEYLEKYDKIIKNRYIDYCQYKGKCSGGYSLATLDRDSRILMSYNGDLLSISTITHEVGHNINHQYINENNYLQYRNNDSIVAEVASLTNEILLTDYLIKNASTKEEKLNSLENIIKTIISNLFGAVREGKIEEDMYNEVLNGGTITKDFMDNLTLDSLKDYYGNSVELNDMMKNSWITRSHYYMNFYLYSYAICISIATSVASKIINGDEKMLNKYIEFLKIGSNKWPHETFEVLGINLEDENVYKDAIKYFNSLLEEYEKLYSQEGSE